MKLLISKRKSLVVGLFVLVAGAMVIWFSKDSVFSNAGQTIQQKNSDVTSLQTVKTDLPAMAPTPTLKDSQQNTATVEVSALPPISAEMAADIRQRSNHTSEGLVEKKHADGSVSMDLQNHFQSVTAAVIGPDGKIIVRHGEDFLANVKPTASDTKSNAAH